MTITLDTDKAHPAASDEENDLLVWAVRNKVPRATPPLNGNHRYEIEDPRLGKATTWTRMSTLAKTLDDATALTQWEKNNVTRGYLANPDLLTAPMALCDRTIAAGKAGGDYLKADLGTAMHTALELWCTGATNIDVPAPYDRDFAAITDALMRHGIVPDVDWIEAAMVYPEVGAAGRLDLCATGPWEGLRVVDLKTGRLDFGVGAWAAQLAGYARAPWHWTVNGIVEAPPRDVHTGIILHAPLGKGSCHVYELDLDQGHEILLHAHKAREIRSGNDKLLVPHIEPKSTPHTEPVHTTAPLAEVVDDLGAKTDQWLVDRLRAIKSIPQAVAIITSAWPQDVGFAPPWTAVQRELINEVIDAGERAVMAQFPPEKPSVPEPPAAITPIESPIVSPELVDVSVCESLKASLGGLPQERINQFVTWRTQAIEAAVSFDSDRPTGTAWPTRIYAIVNAAHGCLTHLWDDENPDALTRAALVVVLGDDAVQPTFLTGALLGSLTPDEAKRLAQIAVAFGDNDAETMQRLGSALVAA